MVFPKFQNMILEIFQLQSTTFSLNNIGIISAKWFIIKNDGSLITNESIKIQQFQNHFEKLLNTTNEDGNLEEDQEHTIYYSV